MTAARAIWAQSDSLVPTADSNCCHFFVDFACEHAHKMPSLCALPGPDHVCARRSQSWHVDNSHQLYTTFSMSDDIPPLCPAEHEENRLLIIRSGAQRHVVDSFKIHLQPRKDDTLLCSLCSRVEEKKSQNVRQPVRTCLRLNVNMLRNKRTIRGYFAMQEVHKINLDSLICHMHTAGNHMHERTALTYKLAAK